ncbi:hypothetical protein V6N11_067010 [Hibiscus sabdariffa]|uniref:Uncharacterized protein n=1 Tax=Hibiscus sabdariffa TaxID=183260 RepID=A0ABR2SPU3_9ROSI
MPSPDLTIPRSALKIQTTPFLKLTDLALNWSTGDVGFAQRLCRIESVSFSKSDMFMRFSKSKLGRHVPTRDASISKCVILYRQRCTGYRRTCESKHAYRETLARPLSVRNA